MTLTKAAIIDKLTEEIGYPRKKSIELVEELLELIKSSLARGEDVLVSGFGKFCVKRKHERKGKNPSTNKELILAARRIVGFKCSANLRAKINKG